MANKMKVTNYSSDKEILKFKDHFVSVPVKIATGDAAVTTVDGKKVIKAGTIYPKNDATAKGVILSTVDVTDIVSSYIKEENVVKANALFNNYKDGFIDKTKLPAQPNELVNLPLIQFL